MGRATLSCCLIVKNEASCLATCLESIRDVADQIVVVDTGSTDDSVNIARQFNADIFHFKWINDFSAARNESIRHATGDWIFWLDADETLLEASQEELLSLLKEEKDPVIYGVQIHNINRDGSYSLSGAHRLFNNFRGIHFSGRIHEQVSPSVVRLGGVERESNIILHHTGYSYTGEKAAAKNKRNEALLLRQVRENPKSAYAHYTLAQHLSLNEKYKEAVTHYKRVLALDQFDRKMKVSLYNAYCDTLIKLNQLKEAKKYVRQSLMLQPVQSAGYYIRYKIAVREKQPKKALESLQKLLQVTERLKQQRKKVSTDILIPVEKIHFTQAGLYAELGENEKAIALYENLLHHHARHPNLLNKLIDLYQKVNDLKALETVLTRARALNPEEESYIELLGVTRIKQEKFQQALPLFETLHQKHPANERIKKILIGLYGKTGNLDRAQSLL